MNHLVILLVAALIGGAGAWFKGNSTGYAQRDLECVAEVAFIEAERAEAERSAQAHREKGRILADRLAEQTEQYREQIRTAQGRANRAIAQVSRSERAFDERIVRLLNELTPIRESVTPGNSSGAATARTAAASTATTTDRAGSAGAGRGASFYSIATAMSQCRSGYSSCRAQLHSLIDYVEAITK